MKRTTKKLQKNNTIRQPLNKAMIARCRRSTNLHQIRIDRTVHLACGNKEGEFTSPTTNDRHASKNASSCICSCKMRVENNEQLLFHLWAHVVTPIGNREKFKLGQIVIGQISENNNIDDRAAFDKLDQCPECLLKLTSPYQKQLHYHNVHKFDSSAIVSPNEGASFLCNICEQMVDCVEWRRHTDMHRSNAAGGLLVELPYACKFQASITKRCKFRSSSRVVLVQHSIAEHPSLLFCPFCLATFSNACLPLYIRHILKHSSENHLQCTRCSLRFLVQNKEHFAKHASSHKMKQKPEWSMWTKYDADLTDLNKLATISWQDGVLFPTSCFECQSSLTDGHFSTQIHSCGKCGYGTNCAVAFGRHQLLSADCNPRNSYRWPFGAAPSNRPSSAILFTNKCQFSTVNPQKMVEHLHARWRHRPNEKILAKSTGAKRSGREQDEARLFGFATLANIPAGNELSEDVSTTEQANAIANSKDNKREKMVHEESSQLGDFLRPDYARAVVMGNNILKRQLLAHDNNSKHPKATLKAMRLALSTKPAFTIRGKGRKNFLREVL